MSSTVELSPQHQPYLAQNHIRIVSAASLFDGHDAAINIMRRLLQATGAEVIHLGHDRSVQDIVTTAIQEDAQALAITSYQGGHMEFFRYARDLLKEAGCGHIRIVGGGGGTILAHEIAELHDYGVDRIFSPDDGRSMGLQGMINEVMGLADYPTGVLGDTWRDCLRRALKSDGGDHRALAQLISAIENQDGSSQAVLSALSTQKSSVPVLGITGTGGAGKSSLTDELVRRFLLDHPDKRIAIVSVDPTRRRSGGALLGDRIRMNSIYDGGGRVYMRSMATRASNLSISQHVPQVLRLLRAAGFDLIVLETSGIGQSGSDIVDLADIAMYVMTPEFGAASQLEKIDMLDFADVVAINKFDGRGAADALRDVQKQVQRNRGAWDVLASDMPVYGTVASQFNDAGVNRLYGALMGLLEQKTQQPFTSGIGLLTDHSKRSDIIPANRQRYLSEISDYVRGYGRGLEEQADVANRLQAFETTAEALGESKGLDRLIEQTRGKLSPENQERLSTWSAKKAKYQGDIFRYEVRGKTVEVATTSQSLSQNAIRRVALPKYSAWGDVLKWLGQENVPGEFPFTAGVFPFKRQSEAPTRMFAGEGGPERSNRRFHYLSLDMPAKRLSTAFDSVTLYGNDPDARPDIYGKVGNSGVSVASLDDAKRLYSGFDLCQANTSVSMTINGPAATILAFFLNAAIDQQCEIYIREHGLEPQVEELRKAKYGDNPPSYEGELPEGHSGLGLMLLGMTGDEVLPANVYASIKAKTLKQVRGTVQADILKEDQAQNTCIYSTEFSLRLMGDIQQYFIDNNVNNFYSVSISGYHMAEAGANPISQLAFTLANGFTFLEYYLARGMHVDGVAPNFSFFFSNGLDPEYAVIGRVARRLWAKAIKGLYGGNERSQKLKYHIQTSGRSLHAQEIAFNDIRTTLQALYAIYDNCNSLHTNAYDEAITTPTEESVRRAMAIQLIINQELGLAKNENPLQGSFIVEELSDLVEEAVLLEFDRLSERGGVLGAMETMYQRSKIQEESLHYESLKHSGDHPIIGVNSFLSDEGSPTVLPREVIRSSQAEKDLQIHRLQKLQQHNASASQQALRELQEAAIHDHNTFATLMETVKVASLGQVTRALFEVGGQYRRNM